MADIDRRHNFALRRLSSRAASTPTTPLAGLHSFTPLISSLITQLQMSKMPLHPGLSDAQITKIESFFNFTFPPDLRTFFALCLPSSPSFPNFLSFSSLSSLFSLPLLSLSPHFSLKKLKRAPVLIPIYHNCYVPSRPCLAGNPVFYIDDDSFFCCAVDLHDFFSRFFLRSGSGSESSNRTARWVEFWTDAAKRFNRVTSIDRSSFSSMSSSSSSTTMSMDVDPERYVEIRPGKGVPEWMGRYLDEIGGALKNGGWDEKEVMEMVHVSESCALDHEDGEEVVKDVLEMKMDRWSEVLRRAGWDGLDLGRVSRENERRRKAVKLPASVQFKFDRLVEEFVR